MDILKRIYKQAAFLLIPAAAVSALIEPKKLPLSIILGGVFALLNLKGMSWGLGNLLGSYKATSKLVILGIIRLTVLFSVITALAVLRLVSLMGLLIGFTLIFMLLLKEGVAAARDV